MGLGRLGWSHRRDTQSGSPQGSNVSLLRCGVYIILPSLQHRHSWERQRVTALRARTPQTSSLLASAHLFRSIIPGFISGDSAVHQAPDTQTHARPLDQGSATGSRQKPISPFHSGLCLITNHVSPAHWLCLSSQSCRVLPTTTAAGSSKRQYRLSLQTSRATPLLCLLTTPAVFACWCSTAQPSE